MTNIKGELKKGIAINFLTKYSGIITQIIIGAILARLLSPKDFGIFAAVFVFIGFFNLISEIGLGPAIIQKKNLDIIDLSTYFYITILIGICSAAIFYISSYLIADFYNNVEYIKICKMLSYIIFFNTINIVPISLLRKKKMFLQIGCINLFIQIVTGIMAIYFVRLGLSYYSLVYKAIITSLLLLLLNYLISDFRPKIHFQLVSISKIYNYSIFQFVFNFINYFSRNLDNIIIAKLLGENDLGIYDKAYKLMLYPVQNLTFVITPVLHPVLSEYQNNVDIIYNTYLKLVKILAILGIPISIILFFNAKEIILLLYGNKWIESIFIFKLLSLTIWVQIINSSSGSIYQAANNTKWLMISGLISNLILVSGLIIGLNYGIHGVAIGILVAFYLLFIPNYFILIKIVLRRNIKTFFSVIIKPILNGIYLFLIALLFYYILPEMNLVNNLLIKSLFIIFVYIILLLISKEYKTLKLIK